MGILMSNGSLKKPATKVISETRDAAFARAKQKSLTSRKPEEAKAITGRDVEVFVYQAGELVAYVLNPEERKREGA